MREFVFGPKEKRRPAEPLPFVVTDLRELDLEQDLVVWLGHSSLYVQLQGKRVLIDPVLGDYAAPVPLFNKAFKGTYPFHADVVPEIDYLIISHDHWDHLDYPTLRKIRTRVKRAIVPLGIGAHLEHWGFEPEIIDEVEWHQDLTLGNELKLHALPARHFSGRVFEKNKTLWASYLFETPQRKIYFSGDSGYAPHFREIAQRFEAIDLAIMENGQYDPNWAQIHMSPEETAQAAKDLNAAAVLPIHAGRFSISNHAWDDPYKRIAEATKKFDLNLKTPRIGEIYYLDAESSFSKWW